MGMHSAVAGRVATLWPYSLVCCTPLAWQCLWVCWCRSLLAHSRAVASVGSRCERLTITALGVTVQAAYRPLATPPTCTCTQLPCYRWTKVTLCWGSANDTTDDEARCSISLLVCLVLFCVLDLLLTVRSVVCLSLVHPMFSHTVQYLTFRRLRCTNYSTCAVLTR